jgi:hypothetical protein
MPWSDGTGMIGFGSMTGRAADFYSGYPVSGYMNRIPSQVMWPARYTVGIPAYGYVGRVGLLFPYPAYTGTYGPLWGHPFSRGFGRGLGIGRGFGRGFGRHRWW